MKTKYSPGPWVIDQPTEMTSLVCETARHSVYGLYTHAEADRESAYAIDKANAELIATAPDLLASLQEAINEIGYLIESGHCASNFTSPRRSTDLIERAQNLIAKAIGGEQ